MGRGTKMTPQQKGKRSKGEFAIIPFLVFYGLGGHGGHEDRISNISLFSP